MTREALESAKHKLHRGIVLSKPSADNGNYGISANLTIDEAEAILRALATPPATPAVGTTEEHPACHWHLSRGQQWCRCPHVQPSTPPAGATPQGEAHDYEDARRTAGIPRYTIEQKEGTIYFRLTEDACGAWVSFANHDALVAKLEERIARAEAVRATPDRSER